MSDDLVICLDCRNRERVQGGVMACTQPRRAGLRSQRNASYAELGSQLAALPQRCPAFAAKKCSRCGGAHSVSRCPWPTGGHAAKGER